MICNFPSPTGLCSLGEARIVMPSLIMEFIGTIRQSAPHERRNRVDHHPKFVIGSLHFGFRGFLRNLNLCATSEATARTGASPTFLQESITTMPEVPEKPQNLFEIKGVLTKFM